MNAPVQSKMFDTLVDLTSGLGTMKDPVARAAFAFIQLTQQDVEFAYRGDWVARKIIDIPAADATRAWREWQAKNSQIDALEELERTLQLQSKVKLAEQKAGLFGGSALVMGIDGAGQPQDELNLSRVKRGALKYVHVLSRYSLATGRRIDDLESPWYGEPEYYERRSRDGKTLRIHPSRVVRFLGNPYPDEERAPDTWADSRFQSLYDTIRRVDLVTGGTAAMVNDAKMDVISIPKLAEALSTTDSTTRLLDRFATANLAKSNFSLLLLDKDEKWERITTSFGGLNDIMRMYLVIASGAADIPVTRMLGQAPSGLHSTGESEVRNYYDSVSTRQATEISPVLSRLDDVLERSACGGNVSSIYYEWAPLWQLSEQEKAQLGLQKAQAFQIDATLGIINEDVLRDARINQLIEDGTYPGIEASIEEHGPEPATPDVPLGPDGQPQVGPDGKPLPPTATGTKPVEPPAAANTNTPLTQTSSNVINLDANFDPEQHPHEPAGSGKGGQFATKSGGDDEDNNDDDSSSNDDKPALKDIGDPTKLPRIEGDARHTYLHGTAKDVQIAAKQKQLKIKETPTPSEDRTQMATRGQEAQGPESTGSKQQFKVTMRRAAMTGRGKAATGELAQPALMRAPTSSVATVSEAQGGSAHTITHTIPTNTVEYLSADGTWKPLIPRAATKDAQPRSLYVRRDVTNTKDIVAWAKDVAGFTVTVPAEQMHVTVAFSRTPVDWMKAGPDYGQDPDGGITIRPGGPRMLDRFGDAVVLCFSSNELSWRWRMLQDIGASWDHADYNPHITITWQADPNLDVSQIEPYRGPIELGPEIFEEVKDDWQSSFTEDVASHLSVLPYFDPIFLDNHQRDGWDPEQHPRDPHGRFADIKGGKIGDLEKHTAMRDYTPAELDWEYNREYKVYTKPHFPDAFKSREDFQHQYDAAPIVHMSLDELRHLGNSMAASGYNKGEKWVHSTFSHRRDTKRILSDMKNGETAPPIVLKSGNRNWLMAGQTRLATGLALGKSIPVKLINVGKKTKDMNPYHLGPGPHGGEFASGPGGGGTKLPTKVGGSFKERTKLRDMLKKETDPAKRDAIKELIRKSYLKGMENAKNKGNMEKYEKLKSSFFKNGGKASDLPGSATANSLLSATKTLSDPKPLSASQPEPPKPSNKYTGDQLIRMYTGSHYAGINDGLREGVLTENQWKFVSGLNQALTEKTKFAGTVYRNVSEFGKAAGLYDKYAKAVGSIIEERGFTSTTKKEHLNFGGGNLKYVIQSKSGVSVSHLSSHPNEAEVLFRSGTRFKVQKVTNDYQGRRVHLEEV